MQDKLYIPKRLNVGFQNRKDTYTGKLAYVIYWDDKGILRKEKSWEGWRDKKISPQEIENIPTEGFVLNKDVGGVRHSYHDWNARMEKVRVYDPRGFEFEINIPNLLFILQECTSVKGKGLDGEFVYAWAGTELILIPTCCAEYKSSTEYTSLQSKKVGKSDMVEGCSYTTKNNEQLIYIGRFDYNFIYGYGPMVKCEKQHVFYNQKTNRFVPQSGFTKIAKKDTEVPVDNYAELVEKFTSGINGSKIVGIKEVPMTLVMENQYGRMRPVEYPFVKVSDSVFVQKSISESYRNNGQNGTTKKYSMSNCGTYTFINRELVHKGNYSEGKDYTMEELNEMEFCQVYVILESGKEIKITKLTD